MEITSTFYWKGRNVGFISLVETGIPLVQNPHIAQTNAGIFGLLWVFGWWVGGFRPENPYSWGFPSHDIPRDLQNQTDGFRKVILL